MASQRRRGGVTTVTFTHLPIIPPELGPKQSLIVPIVRVYGLGSSWEGLRKRKAIGQTYSVGCERALARRTLTTPGGALPFENSVSRRELIAAYSLIFDFSFGSNSVLFGLCQY